MNNRYQHSDRFIHPVWSMLLQDVIIYKPSPDLLYKRAKKESTKSIKRNVALWLGNSIKVYARNNHSTKYIVHMIQSFDIDHELCGYFGLFKDNRECMPELLYDFVDKRVKEYRLKGIHL